MTEEESRHEEYRQREFAERFGAALETWRFEVNSHWTRTSYFSLFQAGAFGALWYLMGGPYLKTCIFLCVLGMILTTTWLLNDIRMHSYVKAWWKQAGNIEREFEVSANRRLVRGFKTRNAAQFQSIRWLKYRYISRMVPITFLLAWLWMLIWNGHNLAARAAPILPCH